MVHNETIEPRCLFKDSFVIIGGVLIVTLALLIPFPALLLDVL